MIATQREWKVLRLLPLVFAYYYVAYGYGFLRRI
jgi:hypothetical protein